MLGPSAAQSVRFFSQEFFNNMDQLNTDDSPANLTKGMNANLLLSCNELSAYYLIDIKEGRLSVKQASSNQIAEFAFSAPYSEWEKIAKGQAKIPGEVVSGRIKFKGSMPKMLLYLNKVLGLESKIMKGDQFNESGFQSLTRKVKRYSAPNLHTISMNSLTIYTSFSFLLDSFDLALRQKYKDYHFHIVTFRDHPARLLEQITKEAKVGVPTADLVIAPHWMTLDLQVRGLLRKYNSSEFDAYSKEFYDPKGAWAAMALSPVGLAYNTELVSEEESPKTIEQVLDDKWRNKLAVHSIIQNIEGRMGLAYLVTLKRIVGERKWESLSRG